MRQIKFRAWDLDDVRMSKEIYLGDENARFSDLDVPLNPGDDLVLMQFTGMLDKNGKEIYEGDIIELYNFFGEPQGKYQVEYKGNSFSYYKKDEPETAYYFSKDLIAVVGNIYET